MLGIPVPLQFITLNTLYHTLKPSDSIHDSRSGR